MKKFNISVFLLLLGLSLGAQSFELPDKLDLEGVESVKGGAISDVVPDEDRVVLVLFNPGCGHCLDFIDSTLSVYDSFENITFVFVYGNNPELDRIFGKVADRYNLVAYDKLKFATSKKEEYFDQFRIKSLPSVFLYDKKKKHKFIKPIPLVEGDYQAFLNQLEAE